MRHHEPDARARIENVAIPTTLTVGRWAGETALRHWQTGAAIPVSDHQFTIGEPETGRQLGFGIVMRDISEKQRAEQERERLLASGVAGCRSRGMSLVRFR